MQQKSQRTSLGRRLQHALTGGPNRRFPGLHSPPGGAASTSLLANRRLAFPILALLAAVTVSLLFLLPGGPLHAQDSSTIEYAEDRDDSVATFTAVDPEGADITSWTLSGTDAGAFTIDGGVLSFAKQPDFEVPTDVVGTSPSTAAADDNVYEVTVQATDESNKVGMHEVTVEVTNVDEAGSVTLSALRPQSQTEFTATLTDPDGDASGTKWQWAKSSSRNGAYSDIDDAIASSYTPKDGDIGSYLRVTATYTDPEGSDKSAMERSDYKVQAVRGANNAPVFPDQDPDDPGDQSTTAMREVAENTAAGQAIGDPLVAEDDDGDILTYTLTGTDADSFSIDWATGQLMTKAALDEEDKDSYTVTVRATDPAGVPQAPSAVDADSDEITVTITVTDVGEPPAVSGDAEVTFEEVNGDIASPLDTYMGDDPDDGAPQPTWSVAGDDGSKFDISTAGALTFKAKPDFEAPTDANKNNVYEVTVRAADGDGNRGEMAVKVTVENEEEAGTVRLSRTQIRVGVPVTASLSDPDDSISGLTWQWSISSGAATTAQGDIEDANSNTYTPVAGDVGGTLTAMASYTDGHGAMKSAEGEASSVVAVDTRNRAPVFEDQDTETEGVQNESTTRKVDENTKALAADDAEADADEVVADNVGSVVTATDPDPNTEALIYTLGGDDADKFRVRSNGQIEVGAGTELDYETKDVYVVTVMAEDSFGESASIMVTITVTDVDEAPDVTGDDMAEYAEDRDDSVATFTAVDPEGADITSWTLSGTDAGAFTIDGGVLSFAKQPDFEVPTDVVGTSPSTAAANDNVYEVTVQATDESNKVGMHEVTVEVTNVDEAGSVTLSALRPQSQTEFTATLTDPDGDASGTKWQWAKSSSRNGAYSDIDDAIASSYTPKDGDIGSYLRVTATYTDPEGSDKSAMERSDYKVQAVRGANNAPVFPDQDPDDPGDQSTTAMREVAENTAAGQAIGDPLVAEDDDGDILTYTLTGTDADSFSIDWATGQLMTKAALDEEDKDSYTVTVRATDPAGVPQAPSAVDADSDEITVTITVTDVGEPPAVSGDAEVTFEEVNGDIASPLDTYMGDDPDDGAPQPTWSVAGDDGSKFDISTAGALTFKAKPDFEAPTDANKNNVYEVTVRAADGDGNRGEMAVKVTVENEEEAGTVRLSRTQIRVGVPVTASLSDPDDSISGLTWQWSISSGAATTAQGDIEDANSNTYTPVAGDVGGTLTAMASYTDGHGAMKSAEGEASSVVAVDTRNRAPVFEDQDTETEGVQNESTTRKVDENTKALAADDAEADADEVVADNVGSVVTATDPDPNTEALIYTLGGDDADKFRVRSNGQIEVGAGTELDYETKDVYVVTVMAEDSFGESASIMVTITVTDVDEMPEIRRVSSENQPPSFPAETDTRNVVEGTAAGADIGAPVTAEDPDVGDALTYTLGGTDAASFDIVGTTGQLQTKAALDYSTKTSYVVTVTATDTAGLSDAITVTINVTAVDENLPPEFPSAATTREVDENTVAGEDIGAPVAASDADDAALTYALSGTDAASFDIDRATGQLKTEADLDYETKASYAVTVTATDGDNASDSIDVAITVTDVDEAGTGDPLVDSYDANDNGMIEKSEVLKAINDYLFGEGDEAISKPEVLRLINMYLFG